jgi:hypothetical protein
MKTGRATLERRFKKKTKPASPATPAPEAKP